MRLVLYFSLFLFLSVSCDNVDKPATSGTNKKTVDSTQTQSPVSLTTEGGVAEIQINEGKREVLLPPPAPSKDSEETIAARQARNDSLLPMRRARTAFNNGIQYYKSGELEEASDAFKLSLTYKADNDKAYYNLGKIYYDLGQKDLSLSFYEDAININPEDSASITAAGLIYFEKGDYPKALQLYNMAIETAPAYGLAYYNRGTLLGQQKQYDKALSDLNMSIKYDTANPNAYMNRGLAFFYMKRQDEACRDWNKAAAMGLESATKALGFYCKEKPAN